MAEKLLEERRRMYKYWASLDQQNLRPDLSRSVPVWSAQTWSLCTEEHSSPHWTIGSTEGVGWRLAEISWSLSPAARNGEQSCSFMHLSSVIYLFSFKMIRRLLKLVFVPVWKHLLVRSDVIRQLSFTMPPNVIRRDFPAERNSQLKGKL